MIIDIEIDEKIHFLGRLCRHKHDYNSTRMSVRFKRKGNSCVVCQRAACETRAERKLGKEPNTVCMICETPFYKLPYDMKISPNSICGSKCAMIYAKKFQSPNRSQIEACIVEKLQEKFPSLKMVLNDKILIGKELDLYIPSLNLAIEINGPTHYRPIYGKEALERKITTDEEKIDLCKRNGITLKILDISKVNKMKSTRFKEKVKEAIYLIESEEMLLKQL